MDINTYKRASEIRSRIYILEKHLAELEKTVSSQKLTIILAHPEATCTFSTNFKIDPSIFPTTDLLEAVKLKTQQEISLLEEEFKNL